MATPNMNLVELVPGITTGPQYATDIVSNFATIDAHDHTTGNGTRIPSAGININSNLEYNGNAPIGQGKSQFNSLGAALSAAGDYRSLHVVAGELFYLDDSGNSVQLTSSGSVAGAAGNITGLSSPASVTFSTNKYVFKDTATSFGILESADVRLFEDSASAITNYVGLKSPASLAATYNLTFPGALPAATRYVASDNTGALTFETADSIGSAMTSTGADAIAGNITSIGADAIAGNITSSGSNDIVDLVTRSTGTSVSNRGVAIASSSGTQTITSTAAIQITNQSITITTSGRPVVLLITFDENGQVELTSQNSSNYLEGEIYIKNVTTNTIVSSIDFGVADTNTSSALDNYISKAFSGMSCIDVVSAGTYNYQALAKIALLNAAGTSLEIRNMRLVAFEL